MADRPSWDDVWFQTAEVIATRSLCSRAQVGCIIVASDQTVVSCSYNGPPPAYSVTGSCVNWCERVISNDSSSNYDLCPSSHAEINGIARSDYSRLVGATLYCNQSVCMNCAKAIAAAGIIRVVHRTEGFEYRNPHKVEKFLEACGVTVVIY